MSRRLALTATGAILGVALALLVGNVDLIRTYWGVDATLYLDRTRLWLAGAPMYPLHQVAGPYEVAMGDVLYPPTAFLLFVPFLALPAALWWAIPIAALAYAWRRLRPRPWAWPVAAALLAYPPTIVSFVYGNPGIWIAAFVAAGTLWRWPAVLVLLKPTLAPFALLGVRSRSWWLALAAGAVVSIALLPLWIDWLRVIVNARGNTTYTLAQIPLLAIPVVAYVARRVDSATA